MASQQVTWIPLILIQTRHSFMHPFIVRYLSNFCKWCTITVRSSRLPVPLSNQGEGMADLKIVKWSGSWRGAAALGLSVEVGLSPRWCPWSSMQTWPGEPPWCARRTQSYEDWMLSRTWEPCTSHPPFLCSRHIPHWHLFQRMICRSDDGSTIQMSRSRSFAPNVCMETQVKHIIPWNLICCRDVLCTDKTGTLTADSVILLHTLDSEMLRSNLCLRNAYTNAYFQVQMRLGHMSSIKIIFSLCNAPDNNGTLIVVNSNVWSLWNNYFIIMPAVQGVRLFLVWTGKPKRLMYVHVIASHLAAAVTLWSSVWYRLVRAMLWIEA